MTRLLAPTLTCPECGQPLEYTGALLGRGPAAKSQEAWRPDVEAQTISCVAGHTFEAIYEQREPWRSVLTGFGSPVDPLFR